MERKENFQSLNINSTLYRTNLSKKFLERKSYRPHEPGLVRSFIPGTIIEILVNEGDEISAGEELLILDAMKMQNRIKSTVGGRIRAVNVKKGDRVTKGMVLVEIE